VRRSGTTNREIEGVPVHVRSAQVLGASVVEDWAIFFKDDMTRDEIARFCLGQCSAIGGPSEGGVPFATFHGTEQDLASLLKGKADSVAFVEPEVMESALPEVDLPDNVGVSSGVWGLDRIGVSERSTDGTNTHIYVVDTGIRTTHQEFSGRADLVIQTNYGRVETCDVTPNCAYDGNGHGTHCAGTAVGKNYGVAKGAKVHGVKAVSDNGRGFQSWVVMGLDWIATEGERPAVASVSLQYNGESWSMETSVRAATRAGVIIVVAAGNVNNFACDFSPAFVPESITVGATAASDSKAQFSNHGSCVNIWAPGVAITSAVNDGDSATESWDGTSMACPHVSGAAALLLEQDPSMKRDQIMAALAANGEKGVLTGLNAVDTNLLVSVRGTR